MTNRDAMIKELKALLDKLSTKDLERLVEYTRLNPSPNPEAASPSR